MVETLRGEVFYATPNTRMYALLLLRGVEVTERTVTV